MPVGSLAFLKGEKGKISLVSSSRKVKTCFHKNSDSDILLQPKKNSTLSGGNKALVETNIGSGT